MPCPCRAQRLPDLLQQDDGPEAAPHSPHCWCGGPRRFGVRPQLESQRLRQAPGCRAAAGAAPGAEAQRACRVGSARLLGARGHAGFQGGPREGQG